jgi:hypothetical protein
MGGLWVRGGRIRCNWANQQSGGHRISGAVISALRKGATRTVYISRNVPHDSSSHNSDKPKKSKPVHDDGLADETVNDDGAENSTHNEKPEGHRTSEEETNSTASRHKNKSTPAFPPIGGGKAELHAIFSVYGDIESVALMPSGRIAFVNFCHIIDAVKAVEDQAQILPLLAGPQCDSFFPLSYGRDRCAQSPPF